MLPEFPGQYEPPPLRKMVLLRGNSDAISNAMKMTITLGKAGRLVVPKPIRDRLHLREGTRLKIEAGEDAFSCTTEDEPVKIERRGKRRVVTGWDGFDAAKAVNEAREDYLDRLAGSRSK